LRANRIIWDFAKDLLIVNGEVFDMILEGKSQELKRKKWLEERNEEDENGSDSKQMKKRKLEEKREVQIINRMWALPLDVELDKNVDVCLFSAVADEGLRQNDRRYPCYVCGPTTSGFSRAKT